MFFFEKKNQKTFDFFGMKLKQRATALAYAVAGALSLKGVADRHARRLVGWRG
jgi:hypothetical protein